MKKYRVVWQIQLTKEFEVDSKEDAIIEVENIDCQHDGSYVSDSFTIVGVEKTEN